MGYPAQFDPLVDEVMVECAVGAYPCVALRNISLDVACVCLNDVVHGLLRHRHLYSHRHIFGPDDGLNPYAVGVVENDRSGW